MGRKNSTAKWTKHITTLFATIALIYTVVLSLALKSSWTFDLITAYVVSRLSAVLAYRASPMVDKMMP